MAIVESDPRMSPGVLSMEQENYRAFIRERAARQNSMFEDLPERIFGVGELDHPVARALAAVDSFLGDPTVDRAVVFSLNASDGLDENRNRKIFLEALGVDPVTTGPAAAIDRYSNGQSQELSVLRNLYNLGVLIESAIRRDSTGELDAVAYICARLPSQK